jgi:hypothetical protein
LQNAEPSIEQTVDGITMDLRVEGENAGISIRANREFDSNVTVEGAGRLKTHDDPGTST